MQFVQISVMARTDDQVELDFSGLLPVDKGNS